MKNLLLLLFFTFFVSKLQAQDYPFELTPNGFVSTKDTTKNFIVYEYPEKTLTELYKKALIYINTHYVSPKDVISTVENETITINGISQNKIRQNSLATPFDINYTIVLMFKDGKIRVDAPSFRLSVLTMGKYRKMYLTYNGLSLDGSEIGIFGKKGNLKLEKAKTDLENFFGAYLFEFNDALKTDKVNKEW